MVFAMTSGLSHCGKSIYANFNDLADGLVLHPTWCRRTCENVSLERNHLCKDCHFCISCTSRSLIFGLPGELTWPPLEDSNDGTSRVCEQCLLGLSMIYIYPTILRRNWAVFALSRCRFRHLNDSVFQS